MSEFSERVESVIGTLTFGFKNDLQKTSEITGGPAFKFEPAEVFGGDVI